MLRPMPSPADLELVLRALSYAAHQHRDQRRKGASAVPYINHPLAVAALIAQTGGVTDPHVLAAAALHDTIEDTGASREELARLFGEEVAALVEEVTDDKRQPKAERKRRQVEHAPHLTPKARLIKLADKICNLRDVVADPPADWPLARRQEYFDWARQVVDGIRGSNAALEAAFDQVCARRPA